MSPEFATIKFGPFATEYHRRTVQDDFREALDTYLSKELLPQVDEPFISTKGQLQAEVDEERFCGPNSLVKDNYILEFAFMRSGESDEIRIKIRYDQKSGCFKPRYAHEPLYLWTAKRKAEDLAYRRSIDEIVTRINSGEADVWRCPRCQSILKLQNAPSLFQLTCSAGCFTYHYHCDPVTKELRSGHFFSRPPTNR